MMNLEEIPAESPLLDEKTRETLTGIFAKLDKEITLKCVADIKEEKSAEMASFLKGVAALSPHIQLELLEPSEGNALDMDTAHLPATGLFVNGEYSGAAFHGVPGGKEINSFVIGIYNLAGPGQEISKGAVKKIGKIKKPVSIKICVSLSCHHCPGVVISCQRIAMLNPLVKAEMYDANLYPDLVEQFTIERVPLVILNDKEVYAGPRSIEDLTQLLLDVR